MSARPIWYLAPGGRPTQGPCPDARWAAQEGDDAWYPLEPEQAAAAGRAKEMERVVAKYSPRKGAARGGAEARRGKIVK